MARQKEKMQVRIDSDLRPLVRQHAKEQSRSIPAEVNFRLRKAYEEPYSQAGTQDAINKLKRSIGTSLL